MTLQFFLFAYFTIGVLLLCWSAVAGNSAREMFRDLERFTFHVGALVIWPVVLFSEARQEIEAWRFERECKRKAEADR